MLYLKVNRFEKQKYGIESLVYLAQKIWSLVPRKIKNSATLNIFKSKIKNWLTSECSINSVRHIFLILAIYKI